MARRRGRPPRVPGAIASARRWLFLTPSEDAALRKEAAANHLTPAAFMREAINAYVSEYAERTVFPARGIPVARVI